VWSGEKDLLQAYRAEILQLRQDGTAELTLSDQVTAGAGGFTFSDSLGSWKVSGPRRLTARFLNLNFDVTGPAATFSGTAVVDYVYQFGRRDPALVAAALGDIARAKGITQIARDTGLGRESLYKALSPEGNPEFATVLKVVRALGLQLHAAAALP
jgi:probable addiction module antidote protein